MGARFLIGTQGWSYPDWVGPFYPVRTPASRYLSVYARAFPAVEVDSSFYAIPPASHFHAWRERTPETFRFTLKLPGELTHERRLRGGDEVLRTFCERAELLDSKLGAILVQLPPDFTPAERAALESFVRRLPRDFDFAVEFRHPGWLAPDVLDLLGTAGVALALSDGPWLPRERAMQTVLRPTAGFAYVRWMGDRPLVSSYDHVQVDRAAEIRAWAQVLLELADRVQEVYGFFNNHYEGHSPASARRLLSELGRPVAGPDELGSQLSLF